MATITADEYLDSGTARTAGEAWTLNGGKLTVRTDTRWHANAPASMTGTFGSMTVSPSLGGGVLFDGRDVRWLPYDTGSGNVPAIGTTVTQGGVSGYLLGVWDSLTVGPTAVGAAMPADGFIKLREVTGGPYTTGALTGIGASATGPDVVGWIEVVADQATAMTTSRLGTGFQTRGDWFYLDDTNGSIAQVLQVPTNGGGAATHCPGVWIETDVADTYEFWPCLDGTTNGWNYVNLGAPEGFTDERQQFVKALGTGQMQIGETYTQSSTYASATISGSYTWVANVVTVTATAHGLTTGEQVHLDFTTGGATADGVYTVVTVTSANAYTVALTGSGTAGNVTHSARHLVTFTTHGLAIGSLVYCDFTSGAGVDGVYEVMTVPNANSYTINLAAAATTGNVTIRLTIGRVPPSGRKTRIPNVIMRQCTTGARATNAIPHATLATRPDFATTGAGVIDFEYAYSDWYFLFSQPYAITIKHSATFNIVSISECATEIVMDDVGTGQIQALDSQTLTLLSNFAGATIQRFVGQRGNATGANDHDSSITSCQDITLSECVLGVIGYARSSGQPISISSSLRTTLDGCTLLNAGAIVATSVGTQVLNHSHCDRYVGVTNASSGYYVVSLATKCNDTLVDGVVFGVRGVALTRVHSYVGIVSATVLDGVTLRNVGTFAAKATSNTVGTNVMALVLNSGANNTSVTIKRVHVGMLRTGIYNGVNTDKGVLIENVSAGTLNTGLTWNWVLSALNGEARGVRIPAFTVAANASVYGTHFQDLFVTDTQGRLLLTANEDTVETAALLTKTGTPAFTSVPSLILADATDDLEIEMGWFAQGHTAFDTTVPTLTGTTAKSASLAYTWAANVVTVTHATHGYKTGDKVWVDFTSGGGTPDGVYTITVTTASAYTFPLTGSGASGNLTVNRWIDFQYKIDVNDGNGYNASWRNLIVQKDSCSMASTGDGVIAMTDTTGLAVDDYVFGTGVGTAAKIVTVDSGTQITVSVNNASTGSGRVLTFAHQANETIDPVDGFKMKWKINTITPHSLNTVTYARIDTVSTGTAQTNIAYPLETVTVTVTVKDVTTGDPIEDARVYLEATGGGPATNGTVILAGLTNASGVVTGTTEYTGQAVIGRARRATVGLGTLYRSAVISDTVTTDGLNVTVLMIPDE